VSTTPTTQTMLWVLILLLDQTRLDPFRHLVIDPLRQL
jgi:hypothetical protein